MLKNIAGCVILYNPTEVVEENIRTYCDAIGRLYLIDNSSNTAGQESSFSKSNFNNSVYIPLHQNMGIAHALNVAAEKALQEGYEWLLMMDQDSCAGEGMLEALFSVSESIKKSETGIIAPTYVNELHPMLTQEVEEVPTVITSGSLLNLEAYRKTGPFRDDLFIDFVDHEYCLRLQQQGFKILISQNARLIHQPGELTCHSFFGRRLCTSNHNYLRRYYITRNRLEVQRQYQDQFSAFLAAERNKSYAEILKIILFEKDKVRKLKSIMLGYLDFKRGRFGKYRYD